MKTSVILYCFFNDPIYGAGLAGAIISVLVLSLGYALQYFLFKKQIKVQREEAFKTNSIKLSMDLSKEFDTELYDDRTLIGQYIINKKVLDRSVLTDKEYEDIAGYIENIIDFFDMLGFYIKNEYIKTDLVWNNFYYWFNYYYDFYWNYQIKDFRFKGLPQVWKNLDYLRDELRKIEYSESGKKPLGPILKPEFERFFREEGDFSPKRPLISA
ncbi:MAG: hypothetical protein ACLQQ4_16950 [Bacteroidia bacterium]